MIFHEFRRWYSIAKDIFSPPQTESAMETRKPLIVTLETATVDKVSIEF